MTSYTLPSLHDVDKAASLIEEKIGKAPIKTSTYLDAIADTNARRGEGLSHVKLFFKCENLQRTGSFKFRGATHFLAKCQDYELAKGVVAYSTGNHAQAVAHAAHLASLTRNIPIPTTVILPPNCPIKKLLAAKSHGATVLLSPTSDPESRVQLAQQITDSTGAVLIPASDHRDIVLGQATCIRELLAQVADLDAVIVPSGGGGLLVGAIAVCKALSVRVYVGEPESGGPGLRLALQAGRRNGVMGPGETTVADGLRCLTGAMNWEHISREGNVDGVFGVHEEQIKAAMKVGIEELGCVIEPSAAAGLAVVLFSGEFARQMAMLKREAKIKGAARVGVVVTGGNVGLEDLLTMVPDLDLSSLTT